MGSKEISLFQGCAAESWLEPYTPSGRPSSPQDPRFSPSPARSDNRDDQEQIYSSIRVADWFLTESFQRQSYTMDLGQLPARSADEEFPIRDLYFFPIQYAEAEIAEDLRSRGAMIWQCRYRRYVSYIPAQNDMIQSTVRDRVLIQF